MKLHHIQLKSLQCSFKLMFCLILYLTNHYIVILFINHEWILNLGFLQNIYSVILHSFMYKLLVIRIYKKIYFKSAFQRSYLSLVFMLLKKKNIFQNRSLWISSCYKNCMFTICFIVYVYSNSVLCHSQLHYWNKVNFENHYFLFINVRSSKHKNNYEMLIISLKKLLLTIAEKSALGYFNL